MRSLSLGGVSEKVLPRTCYNTFPAKLVHEDGNVLLLGEPTKARLYGPRQRRYHQQIHFEVLSRNMKGRVKKRKRYLHFGSQSRHLSFS